MGKSLQQSSPKGSQSVDQPVLQELWTKLELERKQRLEQSNRVALDMSTLSEALGFQVQSLIAEASDRSTSLVEEAAQHLETLYAVLRQHQESFDSELVMLRNRVMAMEAERQPRRSNQTVSTVKTEHIMELEHQVQDLRQSVQHGVTENETHVCQLAKSVVDVSQ